MNGNVKYNIPLNISDYMNDLGQRARAAGRLMASASRGAKDAALLAIAARLEGAVAELSAANDKDIAAGKTAGLTDAMLDRLVLTKEGIANMAEGCRQVAALSDPVGEISDLSYRPQAVFRWVKCECHWV